MIASTFGSSTSVRVEPIGPAPAERYRITYNVPSYWIDKATNKLSLQRQHIVEITLPAGYPREKPYCTTTNPIFHPNFGAYICIADEWMPGQTLADVIVQIGDLLQYRSYNIRSPLNAVAAKWAMDRAEQWPLGTEDIRGPEPIVRIVK
jgi:hypothetical protein